MKSCILKNLKVNVKFIPVLARPIHLPNDACINKYGFDTLLEETINSIISKMIISKIINELNNENEYISKLIYEKAILFFTSNYTKVLSDNDFINFIINNVFALNINSFLMKNLSNESFNYFINMRIINKNTCKYIQDYKNYSKILINKWRDSNFNQNTKNGEFENLSTKFLCDYIYYIFQVYYIYYIIKIWCIPLANSFEKNINLLII